jgi:hypothetical protein
MNEDQKVVLIPWHEFQGFKDDDEMLSIFSPTVFCRSGVIYEVVDSRDAERSACRSA